MSSTRLLEALLKHHRSARGLSQLDLAGAAGISARHLSFLETGRARPSRDMLIRLGETLALSLRDQNELLTAAGYPPVFGQSQLAELPAPIQRALEHMLAVHEPYPVLVFDGQYDLCMLNHGARVLLELLLPQRERAPRVNLLELCFDPAGLKPAIENWEQVARQLLSRLARDHLQSGRTALQQLLSRLLAYPDVPADFRVLDLTTPPDAVFELHLRVRDLRLRFLSTLTSFSAARDVTLEELRIESYYPLDLETEQACKSLLPRDTRVGA